MIAIALITLTAALVSMFVLGLLARSPLARYFADRPDHRKVHQTVIPRLGGVGIAAAFVFFLAGATILQLWSPEPRFFGVFLFTAIFLLVAGGLDDAYNLGYKLKFMLQFVLATVVVIVFRVHLEQVSFLGYLMPVGDMGLVVSIFWMVAVMNAVNIIDGIDGLAGGVSLLGVIGVAALAYMAGANEIVWVCLALAGATLGFLRYNMDRRRKIFLGDTGSQFLGASLGLLTLQIHALPTVNHSILIPLLLVGYPALDTSVAMARRFLRSRSPDLGGRVASMFKADNGHIHHRLVYSGLSHVQATSLLMLLTSGFVATAVIAPQVSWMWEAGIVAYFALALLFMLHRLGFMPQGTVRRLVTFVLGGELPDVKSERHAALRYVPVHANRVVLPEADAVISGAVADPSARATRTDTRPAIETRDF